MTYKFPLLVIIMLLVFSACIFQIGKKSLYDRVIKISPVDSTITIPGTIKSQLYQWIAQQQTGQNIVAGHLLLTQSDKKLTSTASRWLAAKMQMDLYRVDLSALVSKYIGETEKNLDKVFKTAENKQWILFFDEADALFGKRTDINDAHDKYANSEIAYLLQRIESFKGVVLMPCISDDCLKADEKKKFIQIAVLNNTATPN